MFCGYDAELDAPSGYGLLLQVEVFTGPVSTRVEAGTRMAVEQAAAAFTALGVPDKVISVRASMAAVVATPSPTIEASPVSEGLVYHQRTSLSSDSKPGRLQICLMCRDN